MMIGSFRIRCCARSEDAVGSLHSIDSIGLHMFPFTDLVLQAPLENSMALLVASERLSFSEILSISMIAFGHLRTSLELFFSDCLGFEGFPGEL